MSKNGEGFTYKSRILAAASSGFLVAYFCTPFDVVKNVTQSNSHFNSTHKPSVHTSTVVSYIYKNYGIRGFWKGINPALGVIITGNVIFFSCYEEFRKENNSIALAGVKARFISALAIAPIEFIRTKIQVHLGNRSAWAIAREMISEEGILCMWRGFLPTLVRDVPFSASYWKLNDSIYSLVQKYDVEYENRSAFISKFLYPFICGGTSAGIACLLSHPFDVIKTHMQSAESISHSVRGYKSLRKISIIRITEYIYKKKGLNGFSVGLLPRLVKIIPSCAVLLGSYELSKFVVTA